jgi:hypothetical protein
MSRKADPASLRKPRPRAPEAQAAAPSPRKIALEPDVADSDFGLALALGPALRRRPDA